MLIGTAVVSLLLRTSRRSWLPVEALCAGLGSNGRPSLADAEGRELILFGGKVREGHTHADEENGWGRVGCFFLPSERLTTEALEQKTAATSCFAAMAPRDGASLKLLCMTVVLF